MEVSLLMLGGNLGDVADTMDEALRSMEGKGVRLMNSSADHITKPWGYESTNDFLNRAVLVATELSPFELMDLIHETEEELGRVRSGTQGYEDRKIDIDILLFGDYVVKDESLQIPHPRMKERAFVLEPASEIAGDFKVPGEDKTVGELLVELKKEKTERSLSR